jgi:hypothetical protein
MKKPKILKMQEPAIKKPAKTRGRPFTGDRPGPGRPPGCPNKLPKAFKEMLLAALEESGGTAYLKRVAKRYPKEFLAVLGRLLPSESKVDLSTGQTIKIVGIPMPESDDLKACREVLDTDGAGAKLLRRALAIDDKPRE